ncbi:unnamed protein product [Blepharisma stoltei]|uniref:Uncharacterized protein n=1 Tax=Blepharisma stoltei TaxID=1481888 RepID=A0AAU9IEP9_9CILI|nr:unnamed protein product [Blepharisma stoltei]
MEFSINMLHKLQLKQDIDEQEIESQYLWCCVFHSHTISYIKRIDLNSLSITEQATRFTLGRKSILPNSNIYWGILNHPRYGSAIFNDNFKFPSFRKKNKLLFNDFCYYKGEIFSFGMPNIECKATSAKKLNLHKNRWKALASLPFKLDMISCVGFNDRIYLTGKQSGSIFEYDIISNSYSEINMDLERRSEKFLCKMGGKIYLFDSLSEKIYITKDCFKTWEEFCRFSISQHSKNAHMLFKYFDFYKNSLYFIINSELYRFDFNVEGMIYIGTIQQNLIINHIKYK